MRTGGDHAYASFRQGHRDRLSDASDAVRFLPARLLLNDASPPHPNARCRATHRLRPVRTTALLPSRKSRSRGRMPRRPAGRSALGHGARPDLRTLTQPKIRSPATSVEPPLEQRRSTGGKGHQTPIERAAAAKTLDSPQARFSAWRNHKFLPHSLLRRRPSR